MADVTKSISASDLQSRRDFLRLGTTSALGLVLSSSALAGTHEAGKTHKSSAGRSSGPLHSAGALAFGNDNVLFVGDIAGSAIHAFVLKESDITSQADVEVGNFSNFEGHDLVLGLDEKLAALFGTTVSNIVINDMVVHQASRQIFISVERGRGPGAIPAIVKVNHGKLEVLDLEHLSHSQAAIPNEPTKDAMLEFEPQLVYAITDVKYYNGEVFVTGISNQQFASTLYRIPYPFASQISTSTVEIWHPVHGEFETRAPIIRHLVREVNGEAYLFAVVGAQ
jgi:hypothetical protein